MNLRRTVPALVVAVAGLATALSALAPSPAAAEPSVPTSIEALLDPSPSWYGGTFTVTAALYLPELAGRAPTGTFSFIENGQPVATREVQQYAGQLLPDGRYLWWGALEWGGFEQALPVGVRHYAVSYSGDDLYAPSSSAPAAQTIERGGTGVELSRLDSLGDAGYGHVLSFGTSISRPGRLEAATGAVSVRDGEVELWRGPVGASFTVSGLAVGDHELVAWHEGDALHRPSRSAPVRVRVVRYPTGTGIQSSVGGVPDPGFGCPPPNPPCPPPVPMVRYGDPVTFTANVGVPPSREQWEGLVPPAGVRPGGTVTFRSNGAPIATAPVVDGRATVTVRDLAVGRHLVTAAYGGDDAFMPSETSGTAGWVELDVASNADLFVAHAIWDIQGRVPTAADVGQFTWRIADGSMTRTHVAASLASHHLWTATLRNFYLQFLGRPLDEAGAAFFIGALDGTTQPPTYRKGLLEQGFTIEVVEGLILASDEYFLRAGGTNPAFVEAIHRHVLGRAPSPEERSAWANALSMGWSRYLVAATLLHSTEYRRIQVTYLYWRFLGRAPDPAGFEAWTAALLAGTRDEHAIAAFVGCDEYLTRRGIAWPPG
jgi:hypothetical protein